MSDLSPYYVSPQTDAQGRPRAVLYCGDCREIAPRIEGVGLILTDPPYGIAHPTDYQSRGRETLAPCNDYPPVHDDDQLFDPSPWLAMDLPTVLWGANYFADALPPASGWLVWDKERPDTLDQATCELAWTNYVKGVRRFRHLWHGMMKASERGESYHPTQKPVALWKWVLSLRWTPPGMVLDPYMGAGSSLIASVMDGRSVVGIEIEERYCEIAARRIDAALSQGALFPPSP